jgi:hypothetical protein
MEKKWQILFLTALAIFAFSAISAASAFAVNPEWLIDGAAVAATTSVEEPFQLTITDLGAPGAPAIRCEGAFDGTVGPEGKDEITEVLNIKLEKVSSTLGSGTIMLCASAKTCEGESEFFPKNLPWLTQLKLVGAGDDNETITTIGVEVVCKVLGITVTDECTLKDLGVLENMLGEIPPDVLEILNLVGVGACSVGGASQLDVEGFVLISALEGLSLTVSGDEVTE